MTKIESKVTKTEVNSEKLFAFVSDFNNFENIIPADKVKNWQADEESCSFTIEGIGSAALRIIETEPHNLVKITSEGATPINFLMWIQFRQVEENDTRIKITIDPQINMMMMTMVKKPLKQFVDMLAERMSEMDL
ncbi:MAG: SRPBCC family protein [Bacteroidota bacterium]